MSDTPIQSPTPISQDGYNSLAAADILSPNLNDLSQYKVVSETVSRPVDSTNISGVANRTINSNTAKSFQDSALDQNTMIIAPVSKGNYSISKKTTYGVNGDRYQQVIGGADLSVFYVTEVPKYSDVFASPSTPWLWDKDIIMFELDSVLSISTSIVREVAPVRKLGNYRPVGFTRGGESISGHIAFAVFTDDVLSRLQEQMATALTEYMQTGSAGLQNINRAYFELVQKNLKSVTLLNNLDPFHLLVMGTNESGVYSKMIIKNIRIIDQNQYQGIQQPNIVNKVTYSAEDFVPMTQGDFNTSDSSTSSLYQGSTLFNKVYKDFFPSKVN